MSPSDVLETMHEAATDLDALTLADRCKASQDRTLALFREMLGAPSVLLEPNDPTPGAWRRWAREGER